MNMNIIILITKFIFTITPTILTMTTMVLSTTTCRIRPQTMEDFFSEFCLSSTGDVVHENFSITFRFRIRLRLQPTKLLINF